jgi:hypothetical protein
MPTAQPEAASPFVNLPMPLPAALPIACAFTAVPSPWSSTGTGKVVPSK